MVRGRPALTPSASSMCMSRWTSAQSWPTFRPLRAIDNGLPGSIRSGEAGNLHRLPHAEISSQPVARPLRTRFAAFAAVEIAGGHHRHQRRHDVDAHS